MKLFIITLIMIYILGLGLKIKLPIYKVLIGCLFFGLFSYWAIQFS